MVFLEARAGVGVGAGAGAGAGLVVEAVAGWVGADDVVEDTEGDFSGASCLPV